MYYLTDKQQELKDEIRKFVDSEIIPQASSLDKQGIYPRDLIERISEAGRVLPRLSYFLKKYQGAWPQSALFSVLIFCPAVIRCFRLPAINSGRIGSYPQ